MTDKSPKSSGESGLSSSIFISSIVLSVALMFNGYAASKYDKEAANNIKEIADSLRYAAGKDKPSDQTPDVILECPYDATQIVLQEGEYEDMTVTADIQACIQQFTGIQNAYLRPQLKLVPEEPVTP